MIPFPYGRLGDAALASGPPAFDVQNFKSWDLLLSDEDYRRAMMLVGGTLVAGFFGGTLWGGWKGTIAGLLTGGAVANGIGARVYLDQTDPNYRKVAAFTGGIALLEFVIAAWLARKIVEQRENEGRSTWGLAH